MFKHFCIVFLLPLCSSAEMIFSPVSLPKDKTTIHKNFSTQQLPASDSKKNNSNQFWNKAIILHFKESLLPDLQNSVLPKLSTQQLDKTTSEKFLTQNNNAVYFEENKGQITDQYGKDRPDVKFSGRYNGAVFHIRNNGISFQLYKYEGKTCSKKDFAPDPMEKFKMPEPQKVSIYRVDINWLNSTGCTAVETENEDSGYNNYYNVPGKEEGVLFVKRYKGVRLLNIWPGIDVHYYSNEKGELESDWIVSKAEDFKNIKFEVKGGKVHIENGELVITTPYGEIREGKIKVYSGAEEIKGEWQAEGNIVSMLLKGYKVGLPLRIDPPTRIWGTYYGAGGDDRGMSCCTDASGNVYLAGETKSTNNIATLGSHQITFGGNVDAFLVKFNTYGIRLWGTYYGGSDFDGGYSCCTDVSGNVFLIGDTSSSKNITTFDSHQSIFAGGNYDAFLVKFNTYGIRLWGTYYGGSADDWGGSCCTDASGNVFLAGYTGSTNNIATSGSHQTTLGGNRDAFLVKFNSNGVRLWGTYYGGSDDDKGDSCCTDASGNVFLAGGTYSNNNITTSGSHQSAFSGGGIDAFLVKFNSNGVRLWGTYYGGNGKDWGIPCCIDANGNVFLAGYTNSTNNIATSGCHQSTFGGGSYDAFLVKFNSNGVRIWGTYYGGSGYDWGYSCCTDASGNIYLAGWTESTYNISTSDSHQSTFGGFYDAFLVKFNSNGVRIWGTYYGGYGSEKGRPICIDASGNIYLGGETESTSNIAITANHQCNIGGGWDAFLVKFSDNANYDNANYDNANYDKTNNNTPNTLKKSSKNKYNNTSKKEDSSKSTNTKASSTSNTTSPKDKPKKRKRDERD